MLRSHKVQEQTFDHYASFLRNILDGQDKYKPLIEPVVMEAKCLAKNEKDYYKTQEPYQPGNIVQYRFHMRPFGNNTLDNS